MLPPPSPPSPESDHRSILIIAAILAFAAAAVAAIHLLLRFLSRRRRRNPNFISPLSPSSMTSSSSSSSSPDPETLISSLPLFTLSSAKSPSSSLDCAVCLSPFEPRDELRLLPTCRHAFHSKCIDTWLKSTLTCPLCRSQITAPPPANPTAEILRVEIGSVSRRSNGEPAPHVRNYSIGSSFEYVLDDDIEAVVARIRRPEKSGEVAAPPPPPPGAAVAEMAGDGSRSWLREYVDRLATSASSSFSSIRRRSVGDWEVQLEEEGGFSSFYRWLVGV